MDPQWNWDEGKEFSFETPEQESDYSTPSDGCWTGDEGGGGDDGSDDSDGSDGSDDSDGSDSKEEAVEYYGGESDFAAEEYYGSTEDEGGNLKNDVVGDKKGKRKMESSVELPSVLKAPKISSDQHFSRSMAMAMALRLTGFFDDLKASKKTLQISQAVTVLKPKYLELLGEWTEINNEYEELHSKMERGCLNNLDQQLTEFELKLDALKNRCSALEKDRKDLL